MREALRESRALVGKTEKLAASDLKQRERPRIDDELALRHSFET